MEYRNTSNDALYIPALGVSVEGGGVVQSDLVLGPPFELVTKPAKAEKEN